MLLGEVRWEALESEERGALVHTQLIEKAATFLRAAERRLAGKFKATAERRGGGRQQRGRRWQNGEAMAAEVIEQIDSCLLYTSPSPRDRG